jgi:hypothetical protein
MMLKIQVMAWDRYKNVAGDICLIMIYNQMLYISGVSKEAVIAMNLALDMAAVPDLGLIYDVSQAVEQTAS